MKYKNVLIGLVVLVVEVSIQFFILRLYPAFNYTYGPIITGVVGGTAAVLAIYWLKLRNTKKAI